MEQHNRQFVLYSKIGRIPISRIASSKVYRLSDTLLLSCTEIIVDYKEQDLLET